MGRTSVVVSQGLDAIGINPANLGLPGSDIMSMTILPVSAYVSSDFFTYELYARYFKDKPALLDLPKADKQEILDSFQDQNGNSLVEASVRLFGITLRPSSSSRIAFAVDYGLRGGATIPKQYAALLLNANESGSQFDFDGMSAKAYWARTYSISYGQLLPTPSFLTWLSVGVGVKMLQGYGYYQIDKGSATLHTESDGTLNGRLRWNARWTNTNSFDDPIRTLFDDPAGYGLGFDVGISGGVGDHLSFGVSITDLGWITWTRETEESYSDTLLTSADPTMFDIKNIATTTSRENRKGHAFKTSLPSVLRIGISSQIHKVSGGDDLPGRLIIAAEYRQGIGEKTPLTEQPRVSFGLEYRPTPWLPIRSGISIGGDSNSHFALGFGFNLRQFDFDIGTEDVLLFFNGQKSSTGSVGLGMRFRVNE